MNKRIKELVEQAKAYATNSTKDYTGDEPIGFMDYYTEKFAELIVRECRKVIIDDMDSNPDDEAFNDALDHAQSIIGEHFGVEAWG